MANRDIEYRGRSFGLSYEIVNPDRSESILILHGWGSDKNIMKKAFAKYLPEYKHIYLDMPGFGGSGNEMVLHTEDYRDIVRSFLETLSLSPGIVVGHSFGGKVATLLDPPCLVLLSSSGILVPKPASVKFKIALFKLLRSLGLEKFRSLFVSQDVKGMSGQMYETFKNVVDEEFEENFSRVSGKALLFWGESDTATPLWTGEKIEKLIPDARLYPLEGDHFFFMKHSAFIAEEISRHCKERG